MKKTIFLVSVLALLTLGTTARAAESEACKKVSQLLAQDRVIKALDEHGWCYNDLIKVLGIEAKKRMPSELDGRKCAEAEINSALGMFNLEQQCGELTFSVVGGGGGGGAQAGLNSLAGLARMGAMMGGGQNVVRLGDLTGHIDGDKLTVFGGSGKIYSIAGPGDLKKAAEDADIAGLEGFFKGE